MSTTTSDFLRHLRTLAARQTIGGLSDRQLLERFRLERSEASFAMLVQRHGSMVMSVCRRVLHHVQDAEDAFQATFLVLTKKAATLRQPPLLSGWLHGVAYRVAMRLKAKSLRREAHERRLTLQSPSEAMDDITWRELRSVLDEELQKLPEKYRAPLVLCYLEARTHDEAARRLGWSKNTFGRCMKQARQMLARRLTRRGLTLSAALTAPLLIDGMVTATVSPQLVANTVRAGLASALGQATGGLVSAQVIALAEGGVGSLLAKRASVALLLLLSLSLGVGGVLAHRTVISPTLADEPAAPKTAPSASSLPPQAALADKESSIEIRGRVLDPDGKPLAGAKVYVSTYSNRDKTDPKARTTSDADGSFRFLTQRTEMDEEDILAAAAPGYGPDWASLKEVANGKELTLRLVKDDVPIKGRVIDLEGRPIVGASIRIARLRKLPGEDLTPWLKELQDKFSDRKYEKSLSSLFGVVGMSRIVKTDEHGRFELHGIGRERVVQLHIEGSSIEYRVVTAITRNSLAEAMSSGLYAAAFDHRAAPSKPIRGTVREKGMGKPVAGALVTCRPVGEGGESATTDKDGHYEIPGIHKSERYIIDVGGPPILSQSKAALDTPGLQPVTTDFEVEHGLVLRVRVTEKDTGKPVRGWVQYAVGSDNRNLDRYTSYSRKEVSWSQVEKDGTIDKVVLPGPGYIAFRALNGHYARSRLKGKENEGLLVEVVPSGLQLDDFHAVVPINPSEKDPKSLSYNIVLDRGRTLAGAVVDPDGRPLTGTMVYGLHAVMSRRPTREADATLKTSSFTVTGLDPRYSRGLIFYHEGKKLVKLVEVRGDEAGPLRVQLEPFGAITGRLVDAAGEPQARIVVYPLLGEKQQQSLPADLVFTNSLYKELLSYTALTDKEGRFRIEGLVKGVRYDIGVTRGQQFVGRLLRGVTGKPGATVDVGEIKMKEAAEKEPGP